MGGNRDRKTREHTKQGIEMKLVITGGRAKKSSSFVNGWSSFESGLMVIYDMEKEVVLDRFEYRSPIQFTSGKHASILFKACSVSGQSIFLCTKTEVLIYSQMERRIIHSFSHPLMNDVHHVVCRDGTVYVVSTGIDAVLCFDEKTFELVNLHYLGEGRFEDKFSYEKDYRLVESLKPHEIHPNYVFFFNNDLYVTRFHKSDCLRIKDRKPFPLASTPVHDGVLFGDRLYFTAVDGQLIVTDLESKVCTNFNELRGESGPLGWCRGVLPLDSRRVLVGYSVLRTTRFRENIKWAYSKVSSRPYSALPTRLDLYDLEKGKLLREIRLDKIGFDAVFAVAEAGS